MYKMPFSSQVYRSDIPELDEKLMHNTNTGYRVGLIRGIGIGLLIASVVAVAYSSSSRLAMRAPR